MANQFLVEIHNHLSRQIEAGDREHAAAQSRGDDDRMDFIDGKLFELKAMRGYFSEHFDLQTQTYY